MQLIARLFIMASLGEKTARAIANARAALAESAPAAAGMLVDEAKIQVPVVTGNLQDHIHANTLEDGGARVVLQVVPFDEAANEYGFDPAYARRIEYGFIGADKLGRHYHQAAQPYMRPALELVGPSAIGSMKQSVVDAVRGG